MLRPMLFLLPATALLAQDWDVSGGLVLGTASLEKVTHQRLGFALGGGWSSDLGRVGRSRLGLAWMTVPGRERQGLTTRLSALSLSADLARPVGTGGLEALVGLEGHRWSVSNRGTERMRVELVSGIPRTFPEAAFALAEAPPRLRLGLRAGLAWTRGRAQWTLVFHQAEAGGGLYRDPVKGPGWSTSNPVYADPGYANLGPVNPGWFELGFRMRL